MERIGNFFFEREKMKTKNYVESLQSASNLSLSFFLSIYM